MNARVCMYGTITYCLHSTSPYSCTYVIVDLVLEISFFHPFILAWQLFCTESFETLFFIMKLVLCVHRKKKNENEKV